MNSNKIQSKEKLRTEKVRNSDVGAKKRQEGLVESQVSLFLQSAWTSIVQRN